MLLDGARRVSVNKTFNIDFPALPVPDNSPLFTLICSQTVSRILRSSQSSEIFMRAVACTQVTSMIKTCRLYRAPSYHLQMQIRGMDPVVGPSIEACVLNDIMPCKSLSTFFNVHCRNFDKRKQNDSVELKHRFYSSGCARFYVA